MKRRSFLQIVGLGGAAAAAPAALAKAVQSPAQDEQDEFKLCPGFILPVIEEVPYAIGGYVSPPYDLTLGEMPSHSHDFRQLGGYAVNHSDTVTLQRIRYKQWDGTKWNDLSRDDLVKLALGKGTCG